MIVLLSGCGKSTNSNDNSSIISLPTTYTEKTANGYRNPEFSVSENSSSSSTSKHENSSSSPTLHDRYIASKNSNRYHISSCSSAKKIKEENIIIFEDVNEASANGYTPCSICLGN